MNEEEIEKILDLAKLVHEDYEALRGEMEHIRARIKKQKEQLAKLYILLR